MTMEKVLVFGDDGSPGADVAWSWVCAQSWTGWRAEVITAVMPPIGPPPDAADAASHEWEPATRRDASDACGFTAVVHLRADADPRYVLGERVDASLVVIGPTGEGFLKTVHLGSTAAHLLHHPPAPLVVARTAQPVRRVLAAVDGSVHALRALEVVAGAPWAGSIESLELVTVTDDEAEAESSLAAAAAAVPGLPISTRRLPSAESRAEAIFEAAGPETDLIVVGTRGVGVLTRLLAGSTATAVTERAACSVLLAHADAPA